MPFVETNDRTRLFYRDWGTGKPVVFLSSWAFTSPMWEYQMVPFSRGGLRCIAYDRRSHGRSDDPGHGYDFDTLANDLHALLFTLGLNEVTLVGHSMGCCEAVRYVARHGTSRIARIALVGPTTPCLLRTEANPEGLQQALLDAVIAALMTDRPGYFADNADAFFGLVGDPATHTISEEQKQWAIRLILESSPHAIIACMQAMWAADFRPDMQAINVPTLVIHGSADQSAPIEVCGYPTARAVAGSQLSVYEDAPHGLFLTQKDRLNDDLLAFIGQPGT